MGERVPERRRPDKRCARPSAAQAMAPWSGRGEASSVPWMRDRRIDFWRGLCLVDMVAVHLAYEGLDFGATLTPALLQWLRFAAGGFVFVAGVSIALIFLPRTLEPARRTRVHRELRRRALYLMGIHYAATAGFVALSCWRGATPQADARAVLRDALLLRVVPSYGDILPFYAAMLLAAPLLLTALRRGYGVALGVSSLALFAAAQTSPWALSPRVGETFPLVLWQSVFVFGLLFGAAFPAYERLAAGKRLALLGAACVVAFATTTVAHVVWWDPTLTSWNAFFRKVPLAPGEWLRYVSLTVAVLLIASEFWPWLSKRWLARSITDLGRRSLAVYVAHVFVQAAILVAAGALLRPSWEGLLFLAALALLLLLVRTLDAFDRLVEGHATRLRHHLRGLAAPPLGVATLAVALLVLAPTQPPPGIVGGSVPNLAESARAGVDPTATAATASPAPRTAPRGLPLDGANATADAIVRPIPRLRIAEEEPAFEPASDAPLDELLLPIVEPTPDAEPAPPEELPG